VTPGQQRLASVAAAGMTMLAAALHVTVFLNAGGLWRDEVSALALGTMPLREAWANLPFDSMPMGFVVILHAFSAMGWTSDTLLRALGMGVGLALLATLWFVARRFTGGPPLLSLALLGLCPIVLHYGDSLRAYGLGSVLGLTMLALTWDALRAPSRRRVVTACVAAAVAVQFHRNKLAGNALHLPHVSIVDQLDAFSGED